MKTTEDQTSTIQEEIKQMRTQSQEETKSRKIEIKGDINFAMLEKVLSDLLRFNRESSEPIDMIIDSNGGHVYAGFAIVELMKISKAPIRTICQGKACSMAAVILACGTGGRYAFPTSKILIHDARINPSKRAWIPEQLTKMYSDCHRNNIQIATLLAEHCKKTVEECLEAISYDHFMFADKALAFGLIDGYIDDLNMII